LAHPVGRQNVLVRGKRVVWRNRRQMASRKARMWLPCP